MNIYFLGFCGVAIFSMWNYQTNSVSLKSQGNNVKVSTFGGEGTGLKSLKHINWKINQKIQFIIEGQYNEEIDGWIVECKIKQDKKTHFMAKFERAGQKNMLNDFKYSVFVEDFNRSPRARGCQHKRSAEFFNPTFQYQENEQTRKIRFSKARFTKDQSTRPMDTFCKDWTCSSSQRHLVSLETGGSQLGPPQRTCPNNMLLSFQNNDQNITMSGPLKFCTKNYN